MSEKIDKRIVLVIWEDAAGKGGQYDEDEYTDLLICRSVGYLIHKTKKLISLSQDWHQVGKQHRNNITIPMGMVKKIYYLKGGE